MTAPTTPSTSSSTPGPPGPTTRLVAHSPEDLLAVAPVVLGFWPRDSVVMLTFGARPDHQPFHARVDLPDDPEAMTELAAMLAAPAARHRVDRVVLLLYADRPHVVDAAWAALRAELDRCGVAVAEALGVATDRWFPLIGTDPTARAVGVPYDPGRIASHPFLAQAVLDGRVTHGSRDALAATLEPSPAGVDAVAALVGARADPGDDLAEGTWVRATLERHLAGRTRPDDAEAARLLASMESLRVRDAAWSAITRDRARAAVGVFTDLVRRAPRELVPAAAALLGWSAWQAGDGALAWCAVDRCQEVEPDYGLADLLAEALARAVPPSVWDEEFDWKEGL